MNTTTVFQQSNDEPVWWTEFNGAFWLTVSASMFAFAGLALRACLRSRCTNISCCSSLLSCDRQPIADEFTTLPPETPRLSSERSLKMEEGRPSSL